MVNQFMTIMFPLNNIFSLSFQVACSVLGFDFDLILLCSCLNIGRAIRNRFVFTQIEIDY